MGVPASSPEPVLGSRWREGRTQAAVGGSISSADARVAEGGPIAHDGSGSDDDGDTLTHAWTQIAGATVSLSCANTANPSFTAPSSAATLTFSLTVRDGVNASAVDSMTVAVRQPADRTSSIGSSTIEAKSRTAGKAIAPFILPSATGGDAPVSHGAGGLPKGVVVSPELKVSGMPIRTGAGTAMTR